MKPPRRRRPFHKLPRSHRDVRAYQTVNDQSSAKTSKSYPHFSDRPKSLQLGKTWEQLNSNESREWDAHEPLIKDSDCQLVCPVQHKAASWEHLGDCWVHHLIRCLWKPGQTDTRLQAGGAQGEILKWKASFNDRMRTRPSLQRWWYALI